MVAVQLHRWSVQDYQSMVNQGILDHKNVELIDGKIIDIPSQKPIHSTCIRLLEDLLRSALHGQAEIRNQMPIELSQSVPNPDLVVARGTIRDYMVNHPTAQDVLLIIEVANSTLGFDLGQKANIYAQDGIQDYWVVDVNHRKLHVFRQPEEDSYTQIKQLNITQEVSPLHFPDLVFKVANMLP